MSRLTIKKPGQCEKDYYCVNFGYPELHRSPLISDFTWRFQTFGPATNNAWLHSRWYMMLIISSNSLSIRELNHFIFIQQLDLLTHWRKQCFRYLFVSEIISIDPDFNCSYMTCAPLNVSIIFTYCPVYTCCVITQ